MGELIDWKENRKLGHSKCEDSRVFRGRTQCSISGAHCLAVEGLEASPPPGTSSVVRRYVDIISYSLNKDSWTALDGLDLLLRQPFMKMKEATELILWSDRGPHYLSYEFLWGVFKRIRTKFNVKVSLNYFGVFLPNLTV